MDRILNQAQFNQQAHFARTGYLKVPAVFSSEELEILKQFVYAQKDIEVRKGNTQAKIYGLYDRAPDLMQSVITNPSLIAAIKNLIGPNIVFVKNRHNQAAVNSSSDTKTEARLHRDILQSTRGILTAAIYLEDSTVANGATNVIPGSHTLPSVGAPQVNGGGTWMDEHEEYDGLADQVVPVGMNAGDVLLFNGMLFHSVGSNTTDKTRSSIILGFRSADELDASPDTARQILVAGETIYRGNDAI